METHYDTLTFEAHVAGENFPDHDNFLKHLSVCEKCRLISENLIKERNEFILTHPFMTIKKKEKLSPTQFKHIYRMAAVFIVFLVAGIFIRTMKMDQGNRIKGSSSIAVYALNSLGKPEQRKNSMFFPGDRIQFAYSCGPDSEFVLLSIDEAGKVTLFYPDTGKLSIGLSKGRGIPLPHSIELDDYIGREAYIAVFSNNRFIAKELVDLVKQSYQGSGSLDKISLPSNDGRSIVKMVIRKERKE